MRKLIVVLASLAALLTSTVTPVGPAASAGEQVFANPDSIEMILGSGNQQPGTPYPSTINVSGLGTINKVTVTLHDWSHESGSEPVIVLQGPTGVAVSLYYHTTQSIPFNGATVTFDDDAPGRIPEPAPLQTGTYRPSGWEGSFIPPPAPDGRPYDTMLTAFDGTNPNGAWKLWVVDDIASSSRGGIDGGWSLEFDADSAQQDAAVKVQFGFATTLLPDVAKTHGNGPVIAMEAEGKGRASVVKIKGSRKLRGPGKGTVVVSASTTKKFDDHLTVLSLAGKVTYHSFATGRVVSTPLVVRRSTAEHCQKGKNGSLDLIVDSSGDDAVTIEFCGQLYLWNAPSGRRFEVQIREAS